MSQSNPSKQNASLIADDMIMPVEQIEQSEELDELETIAQSSTDFVLLTPIRKAIMLAMLDDLQSENIRTYTQLAEDLHIDRGSIYNAVRSNRFQDAFKAIFPNMASSFAPEVLHDIKKLSKKDWKAGKFILELAGLHTDRRISANINATVNVGADVKSPEQAVDTFLMNLLSSGWSKERIVTRIELLQSQGV